MTTVRTWKTALDGRIREDWGREIDIYETELELRKKGKIEEKLFAETRLRRGAYGQRYDNGQRHDGEKTQKVAFPADLTKGPSTFWDAPGMQRIKIPLGVLTADQLDVLAELAEEYSDQILHVTTRQDIQLHFVHIEDTPDIMRRLAAVGITTREACGNTIRNVTACPAAGTCHDETFDTLPYARAVAFFLLGHDDTQDFGRKVKFAFSGCSEHACALTSFHDLGFIAKTRVVDGKTERGFALYVGGGLGAVPQSAKLFSEFLPLTELFPISLAVGRVFSRLGERKDRQRARMKFLVKSLGIEEFKRLVLEERAKLRPDPRWTSYLDELEGVSETPLKPPAALGPGPHPDGFEAWRATNTRTQAQAGYALAFVTLPLGDFTPTQARAIAELARRITGERALRATVDQNLLFRWVPEADLPLLYTELVKIGLAEPGARTITDITACPGTDTCKLGISSSRGLADVLREHLLPVVNNLDPAAQKLHIKCSGCFNSCGQHHVADLGFLGVSRNVGGRRVPHFQLVVGGELAGNARSFGLAIGAIPSKRIPAVVDRLTESYVSKKTEGETFAAYVTRLGRKEIKALVEDLIPVPPYEVDPSFYSDWGDPREYSIGDIGVGECAGAVVSAVDFGLTASEREVFEAQVLLEAGKIQEASARAYSSMLLAARTLARQHDPNLGEDPKEIVNVFKERLVDTQLFWDPFAGGKFAIYLFRAHEDAGKTQYTEDGAHQLIEEAQLFVDAAHQHQSRIGNAVP